MLAAKIQQRQSGILLYGLVPPKQGADQDKLSRIAERQLARLRGLPIDGLVLYDLQDEKARNSQERPFPFIETLDGLNYGQEYLADLNVSKVVYRAVGKYQPDALVAALQQVEQAGDLTVFVGAASRTQSVALSMKEAYRLYNSVTPRPPLGAVAIAERHAHKGDEHLRMLDKIARGCSFFISQGVYDVHASKNLLSDYHYHGLEHGIPLAPVIFTLTPCGSLKTLEFMKWLGIAIPRWLENELTHSRDILQQSVELSAQNWRELKAFADEKRIPIGCNIESVAMRKVEVEASIELLQRIASEAKA